MAESGRLRPTFGVGEHRVLVATRVRLLTRMRLVRRPRERARVPRGQLGTQNLPGAWAGRQRGELGPRSGAGQHCEQ